jgi:hypothetical protein
LIEGKVIRPLLKGQARQKFGAALGQYLEKGSLLAALPVFQKAYGFI